MSWLFASGSQSTGASASASVLPMNIQGWSPLGWTGLTSVLSKGLSGVSSSTPIWAPCGPPLKSVFMRARTAALVPVVSNSVVSDSLDRMDYNLPGSSVHRIFQARILECRYFLLQGIFLTQWSNPYLLGLLHWQLDSLPLSHMGSPLGCRLTGQFWPFPTTD